MWRPRWRCCTRRGTSIRVAASPCAAASLAAILAHDPGFRGLMTFTLRGVASATRARVRRLLAYPTADRGTLAELGA